MVITFEKMDIEQLVKCYKQTVPGTELRSIIYLAGVKKFGSAFVDFLNKEAARNLRVWKQLQNFKKQKYLLN